MRWFHRHKPNKNMGIMYTHKGQYRSCRCKAVQWGHIPSGDLATTWEKDWSIK